MRLIFEWDEGKAQVNFRSHRISFEEARTIFSDPLLVSFRDEAHSDFEERLISIGASFRERLVLVVHTEQHRDGSTLTIRIISARKATTRERAVYEEG